MNYLKDFLKQVPMFLSLVILAMDLIFLSFSGLGNVHAGFYWSSLALIGTIILAIWFGKRTLTSYLMPIIPLAFTIYFLAIS